MSITRRPYCFSSSARLATRLPFLCLGLGFAAVSTHAEPIDLTDIQGRTIRAELISVDADTVKIRREDGMEFKLNMASLRDEDQVKVRAWADTAAKTADPFATDTAKSSTTGTATEPSAGDAKPDSKAAESEVKRIPDAKKLTLGASRFKGDTNTISKMEGYSHRHEQWGYSFQVTNGHLFSLDKVRIEYNLYARTFFDSSTPSVVVGSFDFPTIAANRSGTMKTKTAEVCKRKGAYVYNTGGELRGIWARLYVDGQLMQEYASPESLKTDGEWVSVNSTQSR